MEEQKNIRAYIYSMQKKLFTILLKNGEKIKFIGNEAYKMAKYYLLK